MHLLLSNRYPIQLHTIVFIIHGYGVCFPSVVMETRWPPCQSEGGLMRPCVKRVV